MARGDEQEADRLRAAPSGSPVSFTLRSVEDERDERDDPAVVATWAPVGPGEEVFTPRAAAARLTEHGLTDGEAAAAVAAYLDAAGRDTGTDMGQWGMDSHDIAAITRTANTADTAGAVVSPWSRRPDWHLMPTRTPAGPSSPAGTSTTTPRDPPARRPPRKGVRTMSTDHPPHDGATPTGEPDRQQMVAVARVLERTGRRVTTLEEHVRRLAGEMTRVAGVVAAPAGVACAPDRARAAPRWRRPW